MANEFKAKNGVITPTIQSTVATGTAPLTVASTTVVTNLNADFLDGQSGAYYQDNANATGTLAIANGGTGTTTAQGAMNAFAAAVTSGSYLRGNGTNVVMSTIQAADVPTLNQNTTGTAANVTGVVAAANGGTGQSSYAVGDLVYASTTTALSKLADVATGNVLISGGVGAAPSYGKVGLSTHVSGTLPVGNGGTFVNSTPTNGQLLIGNGTGYTLATLTAGSNITITNGVGVITIASTGGGSSAAATPTALGTVYGFYDTNTVGIGYNALATNGTASTYNTALGVGALNKSVSNNNTAVGFNALYYAAGVLNTSGMKNTAVGSQAGYNITTGNFNTFIGHEAGKNTAAGITENTLVGMSAGSYTTGNLNTIIGSLAASGSSFSGGTNTVIGADAGTSLTSGSTNTFIGYQAGKGVTSGSTNIAIGNQAGNGTITGSNNTLIGPYSGYQITSGGNNVILGGFTGYSSSNNIDFRTTNNNVMLSTGDNTPRLHFNSNGIGVIHGILQDRLSKNMASISGTVNFDIIDYGIVWYTGSGGASGTTGNWTLNVRGNSANTFQSQTWQKGGNPTVGGVTTIVLMVTQLSTPYYMTTFQIDGTTRTVKWQGGAAPSAGNANSIDMYVFTIHRLGDGYGYDVFGSLTKFA